MPYIKPKGLPTSRIWFVFQSPYASCIPRGSLLSGAMGGAFLKMLREAGIDERECYFTSREPNPEAPKAFANIDGELNQHKPPFVVVVGEVAAWFLPELRERGSVSLAFSQLDKYAGSLLEAPSLTYPHYCIPVYDPTWCQAHWDDRNVTTFIDFGKLREEYKYWKLHGTLNTLPQRVLHYHDMDLDELLSYLDKFRNAKVLSNDVENPFYKSKRYKPHPGYPFLLGLADSPDFGISFELFRSTPAENRKLWRTLDDVLYNAPVMVGQNFFNYDTMFEEMLGFRIRKDRIQDTLIRHHILWPELSHKLQFLTRQYTREPYYKDEGHGWSFKFLNKYRRYNALDATVTLEVYMGQEEEFNDRSHLRG